MKTKIQIKSVVGSVLFEYEKEDNTLKDTVEEAVKKNADLRNADLRNSNLRNASLRNADLRDASLRNSSLRNADLRGASLRNASLRNADLRNSNLRNSNLWNADLWNADLRNAKNIDSAYIPMYCKWPVTFHGDEIQIGCESKTIEGWDKWFDSSEKFETKRDTEDFKRIYAMYRAYREYKNVMEAK